MNENENALQPTGPAEPTPNPVEVEKIVFEVDRRERWALAWTVIFSMLFVDIVLWNGLRISGLGGTVTVLLWYALVFCYAGTKGLAHTESRFLLVVNLLLALSLSLGSNMYFKFWNYGALMILVPIHAFALSGAAIRPWWRPSMLWERLLLLIQGLFGNLGAVGKTLCTTEDQGRGKKVASVGLGLAVAVALLIFLIPLLASGDPLFRVVTRSMVEFFEAHFAQWMRKLVMGLILTPFLFGLVYSLRRPRPLKNMQKEQATVGVVEPVTAVLILGTLVALYLVFLAVQSAGLFGGAAYLEARGIEYAIWARSGFFQLVFVTALNLSVTMAALTWSKVQRGGGAVRLLATGLVAESFVLLCSAVWRMTLYVSEYGLSFKRCMTYWGMAVMAVFLLAALLKIWRKNFAFCRVGFFTAVVAWVLISYTPVDYLVAQNLVERYLDGRNEIVSVYYLTEQLSFDTLGPLKRLDQSVPAHFYTPEWYPGNETLGDVLHQRRERAAIRCGNWQTWTLSAYLAARDT